MDWLNVIYYNNSVQSWLVAAGFVFFSFLLGWLISYFLKRWVIGRAGATEGKIDDLVAGVGNHLVWAIVFMAGLHCAFRSLVLDQWLTDMLWALFVVVWTVLGAVFVGRLVNGVFVHFMSRVKDDDGLVDRQLIPIIRSVVSITVWIIAGLFALANLGFNISSILAGLGIGGLALAMASKDLLSNLFGAFTILIQGPFRVGDAVKYQGFSGTIERLGLRSTEMRTYEGHLVTIPNSLATTSVVENVSKRHAFRVLFKLGLDYGTSVEKCNDAVEVIRKAIESVAGTRPDPLVHFVEFGESSLVFQILYYIEDQGKIMDIRHEVNSKILQGLDGIGLAPAIPAMAISTGS